MTSTSVSEKLDTTTMAVSEKSSPVEFVINARGKEIRLPSDVANRIPLFQMLQRNGSKSCFLNYKHTLVHELLDTIQGVPPDNPSKALMSLYDYVGLEVQNIRPKKEEVKMETTPTKKEHNLYTITNIFTDDSETTMYKYRDCLAFVDVEWTHPRLTRFCYTVIDLYTGRTLIKDWKYGSSHAQENIRKGAAEKMVKLLIDGIRQE